MNETTKENACKREPLSDNFMLDSKLQIDATTHRSICLEKRSNDVPIRWNTFVLDVKKYSPRCLILDALSHIQFEALILAFVD